VQSLLNRNLLLLVLYGPLTVDGKFGPATESVIKAYQQRVLRRIPPTGIVTPQGRTLQTLSAHGTPPTIVPGGKSLALTGGLSKEDYAQMAQRLNCEPAAVEAVVATELGVRSAFDEQGRPTILFERHIFSKRTSGKFDKSDPDISNPIAGGYGRFALQYAKLERAKKLDRIAALESASWGAFQIMGFNYAPAGFASVDTFVTAMQTSVQEQIAAFIAFILFDATLAKALRTKDWTTFARIYNGPAYATNNYDAKMKENYQRFLNRP
jgi:peptidoglycan hydrolase-like protein with peptidoglycan-binding domain